MYDCYAERFYAYEYKLRVRENNSPNFRKLKK